MGISQDKDYEAEVGVILFADYHVHSDISPDSDASMLTQLSRAERLGLNEVCFTDHYDPDYPYENWPLPDLGMYFKNLRSAQRSFPNMKVRAGLELGMVPSARSHLSRIVHNHKLDFVLLSKHVVDGVDPMAEDFFTGCSQRAGEQKYLEDILDDISEYSDFDAIGHLGFVDRGLEVSDSLDTIEPPFTYEDFPDLLDAILRTLIESGKGLEVNTSTYDVFGFPLPHPSILRRFAQLGGDIVTVGSDAHAPCTIGNSFKEAGELIKDCGLRYVCTFERRRPFYHTVD